MAVLAAALSVARHW